MVVDLLGVIEDGSNPAPGVPSNTRKTLLLTRGANATIRVQIKTRGGVPFIPPVVDASNKAVLTVKKKIGQESILTLAGVVMTPADGPESGYKFTLGAADYTTIEPIGIGGRFLYDVWVTRAGQVDAVVPLSTLIIEGAARPIP